MFVVNPECAGFVSANRSRGLGFGISHIDGTTPDVHGNGGSRERIASDQSNAATTT